MVQITQEMSELSVSKLDFLTFLCYTTRYRKLNKDKKCEAHHKAHAPNSETTSQYTRQYGFCVLHLHSKKININKKKKGGLK